jgi:hypothetical protein
MSCFAHLPIHTTGARHNAYMDNSLGMASVAASAISTLYTVIAYHRPPGVTAPRSANGPTNPSSPPTAASAPTGPRWRDLGALILWGVVAYLLFRSSYFQDSQVMNGSKSGPSSAELAGSAILIYLAPIACVVALCIPARRVLTASPPGFMERHPWIRLGAAIGITILWITPILLLVILNGVITPDSSTHASLPFWLYPVVSAIAAYAATRTGLLFKRKWCPRYAPVTPGAGSSGTGGTPGSASGSPR